MKTFLIFKLRKFKEFFYDHLCIFEKYPKTGMLKVLKTWKVFSSMLAHRLIFNTVVSESPLLCPQKHFTLLVPCPRHEYLELSISCQPWEIFLNMAKVQDGRSKSMSNSKKKKTARFGWLLIKYTFKNCFSSSSVSYYVLKIFKIKWSPPHCDTC